jgi:hypothetical protein
MSGGAVITYDGVAVMGRGDLFVSVYHLAARLDRTRWLFEQADRLFVHRRDGFMGLLIVLPKADPPDAATRRENVERMRKLGPALRRIVTVPLGDAFRASIVRTVMRGLNIIQGGSRPSFVADTVGRGLDRLLEGEGADTPSRGVILADLSRICAALKIAPSEMGIGDGAIVEKSRVSL